MHAHFLYLAASGKLHRLSLLDPTAILRVGSRRIYYDKTGARGIRGRGFLIELFSLSYPPDIIHHRSVRTIGRLFALEPTQ